MKKPASKRHSPPPRKIGELRDIDLKAVVGGCNPEHTCFDPGSGGNAG